MQMSERQWRVVSLLEQLNRGEVTVGEVAVSLRRSRRQVQRLRKRLAGKGGAWACSWQHRSTSEAQDVGGSA